MRLTTQNPYSARIRKTVSCRRAKVAFSLLTYAFLVPYFYSSKKCANDKTLEVVPTDTAESIVELKDESKWKTLADMEETLGCSEVFEQERPLMSQTDWDELRKKYQKIVGETSSLKGDAPNGFAVPVHARQAPPKGRAIFATKDIPAGELIWSTMKTARFQDAPSYRKFLYNIDKGTACDVLIHWSYIQDIGKDELRISIDLDDGSLCNDSSSGNMGCDEEAASHLEGGCKTNYFALRDIKAGEELLCMYSEFNVGKWGDFGLFR